MQLCANAQSCMLRRYFNRYRGSKAAGPLCPCSGHTPGTSEPTGGHPFLSMQGLEVPNNPQSTTAACNCTGLPSYLDWPKSTKRTNATNAGNGKFPGACWAQKKSRPSAGGFLNQARTRTRTSTHPFDTGASGAITATNAGNMNFPGACQA